ncbi:MAG: AAA family ATPase [Verrucomicrobiota bacterium]
MLTNVHLKNFRGFKDTTVGPLKRVNLIIGQNNTGKTGLLEALALLLADPPRSAGNLPSLFRTASGDHNENFWKWLCYNKDPKNNVEITGKFDGLSQFGVWLGAASQPQGQFHHAGTLGNIPFYTLGQRVNALLKASTFSTHPTNPRQDAIDYNRVVLRRKKKQVEGLLQKIEPRLQAVETLQTGSEPLLYADVGLSEMIPVTQLGQGFSRLLDIYSEIVAAEAKVLLVDEIENGLHHSVLPTIWRGLFNAAKEVEVQIFATTHSWECVLAADAAAREDSSYELNLIRLDRVNDNVKATIIDKDALSTAKELHWEMR